MKPDTRNTNNKDESASDQGWLNRTVASAGITSALGDFCYETTTVILPGFLVVLSVADAVASFTKIVSGYVADKLGHRKLLVLVDYGLTPVGQALIAQGDTVGAVLGPFLDVTLLGLTQDWHWEDAAGPFRFVLWLLVIPCALAVLAFLTLVKDPQHSPNPALKFFGSLRGLPTRFKRYLGAVGVFGIGGFSHALLILAATALRTSFEESRAELLARQERLVKHAVTCMTAAMLERSK